VGQYLPSLTERIYEAHQTLHPTISQSYLITLQYCRYPYNSRWKEKRSGLS